ncbi:hypothetical protein GGTG_09412 [Gaeumannomyces tritici R3-111a-1]|uniref:Uncharacterized protein n=1 Tax=Gaeumannomyces tritici (strain R3-111a-1) TaxID=644352 RepID=J3P7B8_GAET3|nr:hypothetical protein GGTG_09412 [Gaeumannomyces tritici R3-111a-1]EJT72549.1 hypothetical protein GGTG_09412 [Gaeumannomyces tritici R3-111a-1]
MATDNEWHRGRVWSPQDHGDDRNNALGFLEQEDRSDGWRKKMSSWLRGCSSSTSSSSDDEPELPPHLQVRLGGPVVSSSRRRGSAPSPKPETRGAESSALAAAARASLLGSCHGFVPAGGGRLADVGEGRPLVGWSLRSGGGGGGRRRWRLEKKKGRHHGKGRHEHARDPSPQPASGDGEGPGQEDSKPLPPTLSETGKFDYMDGDGDVSDAGDAKSPLSETSTFYIEEDSDGDSDAGDDDASPWISPCASARLRQCGSPAYRTTSPLQPDEDEQQWEQGTHLKHGAGADAEKESDGFVLDQGATTTPFRLRREGRDDWAALMSGVGAGGAPEEGRHRGCTMTRTKTPDWAPSRPLTRRGRPPVTAATALGSNPFRPRTFDDPREIEGLVSSGARGNERSRCPSPDPAAVAAACFFLDVGGEVAGGPCQSPSPRAEAPTYAYDGGDWGNYWAGPDMQFGRRDSGFASRVPSALC